MVEFLLNKKKVFEQYNLLKKYADIVSYSYKTNEEVGDILVKSDSMFSINSFNTLKRFDKKTFDFKRILYFIQGENKNQLKILLENVTQFVVDNESDLENLLEIIEEKKVKINLFIRMKFKEHTIYTGKFFVYGISWKRANEIIKNLNSKYISSIGIHFHRKTQNIAEWYLKDDLTDAIDIDVLKKIDIVNIGGGIPYQYVNSNPNLDYIFKKIEEFRNWLNQNTIKLMLEPGRFICAPSIRLKAKVINKYDNNLIIDCSIFNASMDTFLLQTKLPIIGEIKEEKNEKKLRKHQYLIKGCSPDSLDIFRYKVVLNREINIGDEIIFENAGAYNFHTEFNDLDKIKTIIEK